MTTIVYCRGLLAGDRRVSFGSCSDMTKPKIFRRADGALVGAGGSVSKAAAFVRWFLEGETEARPSLSKNADGGGECATALVVRADGTLELHDADGWYAIESELCGIGSGNEYAIGALTAGASMKEAMAIAALYDGATGDEIDVLLAKTWKRVCASSYADAPSALAPEDRSVLLRHLEHG